MDLKLVWILASGIALNGALGADFSYARIKGSPHTLGEPYGAVTVVSPFQGSKDEVLFMFLLVDEGPFKSPWQRAQAVADLLPKVAELVLFRGEVIRVGPDQDGHMALFVSPATSGKNGADLKVVSILDKDLERFRREEKAQGSPREITRELLAQYWQTLLVDYLTLFVRFPLSQEKDLYRHLLLTRSTAGQILKRVLIEVEVGLKYDGIPEDRVTPDLLRAKLGEAIRSLSKEQWAQLMNLAFKVPPDFGTQDRDPRSFRGSAPLGPPSPAPRSPSSSRSRP